MELNIGQVYRRTDLHGFFGGQQQGGISTPTKHRTILLFTGESGEQYGYEDGFQEDGTFWYTGEGQIGDMEFVRGNKAILNAGVHGKTLYLFEYAQKGHVRYLGECSYLAHHHALAPDINGQERRTIVFELVLAGSPQATSIVYDSQEAIAPHRLWQMSLDQVRVAAMSTMPTHATTQQRRVNIRVRSAAVRIYALRRADGFCEGCGQPAPFKTREGRPYLEPHHIHRLADGGPDHPAHVAALCPNCHRRVHHGQDGDIYNTAIGERIKALELSYF